MTELAPYHAAFERITGLYRELLEGGVPLRRLDFGGGLGITYRDEPAFDLPAYAATVRALTASRKLAKRSTSVSNASSFTFTSLAINS